MMESMIGRVAKAIAIRRSGTIPPTVYQKDWDMARAAIEAMREPTDAMLWAEFLDGSGQIIVTDDRGVTHDTAACWQAMIERALAEPELTKPGQ